MGPGSTGQARSGGPGAQHADVELLGVVVCGEVDDLVPVLLLPLPLLSAGLVPDDVREIVGSGRLPQPEEVEAALLAVAGGALRAGGRQDGCGHPPPQLVVTPRPGGALALPLRL